MSKLGYMKKLLDNLDWVEFCVDGYDEDTVSKYRVGANWDTVKRNLETISKINTECIKKMRVLMFKYNDDKEDIYRNMAKKYGMDYVVFGAPLIRLGETLSERDADEWLPTDERYQRYHKDGENWLRTTGTCYASPMISVHGTVHPCCLDWDLEHVVGNLITEKWGDIMEKQRKLVPTLGKQNMCKLCCIPSQIVNFMEKII
jgi:hypothetical protein